MSVKLKNLRQMLRTLKGDGTVAHITECLENGDLKPQDFSIQVIAEATMGHEFVRACDPREKNDVVGILEAADAVDSTAFSNITGQIVYSQIRTGFNNAMFVMSGLIDTVPTRLSGEKIPGLEKIKDGDEVVKEGMPFPSVGFGEDYINTPETDKRGLICGVTKEAIFFDRTGLMLQHASSVGQQLGIRKEKLIGDAISGTASTFETGGKWKYKGTEYDVYETNTVDFASYWYTNSITDVLTDHTDIDVAMQLIGEAQDPVTREPIDMPPMTTLLVPPALMPTAWRIANATELRKSTASAAELAVYGNRYSAIVNPVESKYLYRRLIDNGSVSAANARKYWFLGDFRRAFAWMENFPLTTAQEPVNSTVQFEQDIVVRYKASMRGCVAVLAPQYVLKSTGAG